MDNKIYEKLNEIQNLDDRVILKKILNGVFSSLEEYTKNKFDELENRVFNEIEYVKEKYNIFCTITNRNNLDPTNEFLHPILEEDKEEVVYEVSEILKCLNEEEPINMFKVFLKCDYLILKDIFQKKKKFKGSIKTNKNTYIGYFELKQNKQYINKTIDLYKMFIDNNIPWTTVNNPYIYKIADVVLVNCEEKIKSDETINEIVVDFEDYTQYVQYNPVPLWNIKEIYLKSMGFPMPCEDKINYEHLISLKKEGENNGYLVKYEGSNIEYVKFMKNSLVITSSKEESEKWNIWEIVSKNKLGSEVYENTIISNETKLSFAGKLAMQNRYNVKTKAELERIISSFKVYKYLELKELKLEEINKNLQEDKNAKECETYNMNEFIIDEIRENTLRKTLALYFKPKDQKNYFNRDILSFFISEIQLLYPEYECEGRLI